MWKHLRSETFQDICKKTKNDEELKVNGLEFQRQVIAACFAIANSIRACLTQLMSLLD